VSTKNHGRRYLVGIALTTGAFAGWYSSDYSGNDGVAGEHGYGIWFQLARPSDERWRFLDETALAGVL
jgi:hypothetical protein